MHRASSDTNLQTYYMMHKQKWQYSGESQIMENQNLFDRSWNKKG